MDAHGRLVGTQNNHQKWGGGGGGGGMWETHIHLSLVGNIITVTQRPNNSGKRALTAVWTVQINLSRFSITKNPIVCIP